MRRMLRYVDIENRKAEYHFAWQPEIETAGGEVLEEGDRMILCQPSNAEARRDWKWNTEAISDGSRRMTYAV